MKKYIMILMMLYLGLSLYSQDRGEKIMEQVEAQKVAFFTKTLDLSVEESQVFWPVYNEYQDAQRQLRKTFRSNYAKRGMNDQEAAAAIADYLQMEEETLQLKKQMYQDLQINIPPSKLVRLQWVENQFKQKLLERIKKRQSSRKNR